MTFSRNFTEIFRFRFTGNFEKTCKTFSGNSEKSQEIFDFSWNFFLNQKYQENFIETKIFWKIFSHMTKTILNISWTCQFHIWKGKKILVWHIKKDFQEMFIFFIFFLCVKSKPHLWNKCTVSCYDVSIVNFQIPLFSVEL